MELPELVGSPRQVTWAHRERTKALRYAKWTDSQRVLLEHVIDASWWIANRHTMAEELAYKQPQPWQLFGGPPAPPKKSENAEHVQSDLLTEQPSQQRQAQEEQNADDNDAARFAASVSRTPVLAEVTILALLARLYKKDSKMRITLKQQALEVLVRYNRDSPEQVRKDAEAISRILNFKD